MVEKMKNKTGRCWQARHSREAALRLYLGQTKAQIAAAMGFTDRTVRTHVQAEGLAAPMDGAARLALLAAVEVDRVMAELLDAEPGSPVQARLRTSFLALRRGLAGSGTDQQESDMKTRGEIGEMSDDELRNYVASLVPGLELKTARDDGSAGLGTGQRVQVSDERTGGSEAAGTTDALA